MKRGQMVGARATLIHLRRVFAGVHGNQLQSPLSQTGSIVFLPVCVCVTRATAFRIVERERERAGKGGGL